MTDARGLVIVSDMDGTLLDHNGSVPPANLAAIERFRAAGGRFTLASGRYGKALERLFPKHREYVNSPAILCNGAVLCDLHTGQLLREVTRDAAEVAPVLNDLSRRFPELEIHPIIKDGGECKSILPCELEAGQKCLKIVTGAEPEYLERVRRYVAEQYGNEWSQSKSCRHLLELLIPQATKGVALSHLRHRLEELDGKTKIIAVGDYENDLDMLMAADIAACPENATDEVKGISKIRLCHHRDGCIADLVNKILNDINNWR